MAAKVYLPPQKNVKRIRRKLECYRTLYDIHCFVFFFLSHLPLPPCHVMSALARLLLLFISSINHNSCLFSLLTKVKKWTYCDWEWYVSVIRCCLYTSVKHGVFSTSSNSWEPAAETNSWESFTVFIDMILIVCLVQKLAPRYQTTRNLNWMFSFIFSLDPNHVCSF